MHLMESTHIETIYFVILSDSVSVWKAALKLRSRTQQALQSSHADFLEGLPPTCKGDFKYVCMYLFLFF